MLGILLIYFIGKYFYELAQDYYKNRWLWAILAVILYYAAGAIFGVILALCDMAFNLGIDWDNNFGINLLGIPVGLLADYGLFVYLKNKWHKESLLAKDEIQDIGKE